LTKNIIRKGSTYPLSLATPQKPQRNRVCPSLPQTASAPAEEKKKKKKGKRKNKIKRKTRTKKKRVRERARLLKGEPVGRPHTSL